jgi:hypothetical protein
MNPQVTNVKSQNVLSANGKITTGLAVTWSLGPHGPFTLITNQTDLANGKALQEINALAAAINALPGAALQS